MWVCVGGMVEYVCVLCVFLAGLVECVRVCRRMAECVWMCVCACVCVGRLAKGKKGNERPDA